MNILIDELPMSLSVLGRNVKINYGFRACLPIIMAFEDNDLTQEEKILVLISDLFPNPNQNIDENLLREAMWFLNCGEIQGDEKIASPKRLYSFSKDANFIYAAFRQTHGIDLNKAKMHWWEFVALFMDLGQDTAFCQLVSLRKRLADGTALPEERKMASASPELFEIDELDTSSIEEKEMYDEFMRQLDEAQKK